jgi:hypothetical protein
MSEYEYCIGTSSGSMANLEEMSVSGSSCPIYAPKGTYQPYSDQVVLVSGLVRGLGYPKASWNWSIIPQNQRDALRQFCPGQSANVYIKTKTMDSKDSYETFSAVMIWPTQTEERDTGRRINFTIEFRFMVKI